MHQRLPYKLRQTQEKNQTKTSCHGMMTKQMTKPSMDDLPRCSSTLPFPPPPAAKTWGGEGTGYSAQFISRFLSPVQTNATLLANNSHHCWISHVGSVCAHCCMLLRVIGTCCAKFETGQTFRYVQTDAATPSSGKYLDADFQTDLHTTDKRIRSLS